MNNYWVLKTNRNRSQVELNVTWDEISLKKKKQLTFKFLKLSI